MERPTRRLAVIGAAVLALVGAGLSTAADDARAAIPVARTLPRVATEAARHPSSLPSRAAPEGAARRGDEAAWEPATLVAIADPLPIRARPGRGERVGTMPDGSRFYDAPIVAWVREVSRDGRYGLVSVPYTAGHREGWIALEGLETDATRVSVEADLSEHRIVVRRGDAVLFAARAGTGASASPTPVGDYFVTDLVAFPGGGALGTFAFGISGIQPNLPPGWGGGDQLAIHGTGDPSSIGRSASAGCLRVSEPTLDRLRGLLEPGTPVVVHA